MPLPRRTFLACLATTAYALAAGPLAAAPTRTPDTGLAQGDALVDTADGQHLPVYWARPAAAVGKLPVVLVVQEIFGVHEHIRDVCRRLAHQGYFALAPELFVRQGDPRGKADVQAILADIVAKVPDRQVMDDLDATLAWAGRHGGDSARAGVVGFCWGGRIVWLYAAARPNLKAGVAFYGRLAGKHDALTPQQPLDVAGELKVPVLGLYGGKDEGIPQADVDAMRRRLSASGQIVVYPDAGHAFHADYRASYQPDVARDAWARTLQWLQQMGVGG
ncbi:dienelactone hydrolase family protein [Crenobacter caeni]|uniref:Dienelactone hydrolase family protein n=1 Tax=Crenobacter caeni TaxID=2705474 RepID=A0A6B2KSB8_9NEIS|nr:dienelactone hydrolase family protein [Crenobacter caeni]NDV13024.1 dienelactone hydrolase family protein [Crenobacter caeni]